MEAALNDDFKAFAENRIMEFLNAGRNTSTEYKCYQSYLRGYQDAIRIMTEA